MKLDNFTEAISKGSKRGKNSTKNQCEDTPSKKQTKLSFGAPASATQDDCDRYFVDMIVNDMLPINLCNSKYLKRWVHSLNSKREVMSATTTMRRIKDMYENKLIDLNQILARAMVVSTTADCWTSKFQRRDYLGMTAHWISTENDLLVRKKAVLVCKELHGSHTFEQLATEISHVHSIFNLEQKTAATTTDNATNFCKVIIMIEM